VAQLQVSILYERGEGVAKDLVQALMWLRLAASQGNQVADAHQAAVELEMTPAQIEAAETLANAWRLKMGQPKP
jgi:TPR repeat protein